MMRPCLRQKILTRTARLLMIVFARPPGAFLTNHSVASKTPCGRSRLRKRRAWRPCHQLRPSNGLKLATVNTQGLQWNKLSHRPKLQQVIRCLRDHRIDALFLTDLHFAAVTLETVFIEEFCFVLRGRVGLVLRAAVAQFWETAGRQVHTVDSDRLLALCLPLHGQRVCFTAMYTPADQSPAEKRKHYHYAQQLHLDCLPVSDFQLWGGDFNGHIASGEAEPDVIGPHGLAQPGTDYCWWSNSQGVFARYPTSSCGFFSSLSC